ncbi:MAG: hypothetical protein ACOVQT_00490 [Rubrivivax sp.]|jgi:hypothetical protein
MPIDTRDTRNTRLKPATPSSSRRRLQGHRDGVARLLAATVGLCTAMPALGSDARPTGLQASAEQTLTYESNLFRLPGDTPVPAGRQRSDTLSRTTLSGAAVMGLGRQRLGVDWLWEAGRFNRNAVLDHDASAVDLRFDWSTRGELSGVLRAQRDRSLVRFGSDGLVPGAEARNLGTTTRLEAVARLGGAARWSTEVDVQQIEQRYSAASFRSRALDQSTASWALHYRAAAAWRAWAGVREVRGRYPFFAQAPGGVDVEDRFDGRYIDFGGRWADGGPSTLDLRLSVGRTRFDRATASDLSGLTGTATWTWRPTGKLAVQTRLARDRGQESKTLFFPGSGRVADFSRTTSSVGLTVDWAATAKIAMQLGVLQAERDLADTRQDLFGRPLSLRGQDRTSVVSAGLTWSPQPGLSLGCEVARESRAQQGLLSSDYDLTVGSCRARLNLR